MLLTTILTPSLIQMDLPSCGKYDAFEELLSLLVAEGLVTDTQAAFQAVKEREEKMSTGIVPLVGIPHGRLPEVNDVVVALGLSKTGIDYGAENNIPVKVIFLVLSESGNPGPHLQLLAEISRLVSNPLFVKDLLSARTSKDVIRLIEEQE